MFGLGVNCHNHKNNKKPQQNLSEGGIQECLNFTDWRESQSRLGLETKSIETLGLVPVSYKIFKVVSSRSCFG